MTENKILKIIIVFVMACFVFNICAMLPAFADKEDHKKEKRGREHHSGEKEEDDEEGKEEKGKKGHELTGFIAAGLFVLANAAAAINIAARALIRSAATGQSVKDSASALMRFLQKHLRIYHYIFNLLAVGITLFHWFLSKCSGLSLQKWATAIAILWVISGIILKYRLVPQTLHRKMFQVHGSFFLVSVTTVLVVVGHILTDD